MDAFTVLAWLVPGLTGGLLLFLDWTEEFDMDWGLFFLFCLLALTGPFCFLIALVVLLRNVEIETPRFFKARSTSHKAAQQRRD